MNEIKTKFNNRLSIVLLGILAAHCAMANEATPVQGDSDFSSIKATYKAKNYNKLIQDGESQLKIHPNDVDVQLYMGLSYYQLKQYSNAEHSFNSVLSSNPKYKDAINGQVKTYMAQKKYTEAKKAINNGLSYYPQDKELLTHQDQVNWLMKNKTSVSHKKSKSVEHKTSTDASNPKKIIHHKENVALRQDDVQSIRDVPHFELVAVSTNASVANNRSEYNNTWDWSGITLYRENEYGAFGAGVNYANRQGMGAPQLYLNAQPNLNKYVWLDLTYAQASKPNLFPDNTVVGELYGLIGNNIEASIGEGYRKIENTYFNTVTGSITKYIANYSFTFRPNHFVPKSGPDSTLYTVRARRYNPNNPDQYFGVVLSSGTSPDLFDLLTVAFFKVKNNIFLIEGQQPVKDTLAFIYGGGYETQKFPTGFVRRLAYGTIGLKLRFE